MPAGFVESTVTVSFFLICAIWPLFSNWASPLKNCDLHLIADHHEANLRIVAHDEGAVRRL